MLENPIVSQGLNNHAVATGLSEYYMVFLEAFASVSEGMKVIREGLFSRKEP